MTRITTPVAPPQIFVVMSKLVREAVSLALVVFPALYGWWVGRRLMRRIEDPAFPELRVAHQRRVAIALGVCLVAGIAASSDLAVGKIATAMLAILAASFSLRRAIFHERRGLLQYMTFTVRFWIGALGAWLLIAVLPALVHAAGDAAAPVAIGSAALTLLWVHLAMDIFAAVLSAAPLEDPDLETRFAKVLSRSRCPAPRILRSYAPGGHWVNAFALPSHYRPGVLFTDGLLAALTPPETEAIFAHEVAHLEHYSRRKLVLRDVLLLMVVAATLASLFWLGPQSEAAAIVTWAWPLGCFLALLLAASRNQAHEHQSDLRAVELARNPEALISALTKLHSLMHLPRRWGAQREHQQTHPSLARRVRAIREAAKRRGLELEAPRVSELTIRSAVDPAEVVVMASDRLYWLRGVDPHSELDPSAAVRAARDCRTIRYDELADLRLEVGRGARRYLVATDSRGSKLQLALPPEAVADVKGNLEGIELVVQDTSPEVGDAVRMVTTHDRRSRFWAALALFIAFLPPQSLHLFVASGITLLRPGGATLAAAGAISVVAALLGFRTVHTLLFETQVVSLLIGLKAVVGIALCVLAVERSRKRMPERRSAWQAIVVALGALAFLHLMRGAGWVGSPLPTMELHLWARYDSGIVLALLGITAALWTLGTARARVPAVATFAASALAFLAGTTWFRDRFGDDPLAKAAEPIPLEQLPLEPWRQHIVEGRVGDLQLSPTGRRVALRISHEEFPSQYASQPRRFDVEVGDGDFTSFVGWDLKFTNDDLVAVLTASTAGFALERFRLWPEHRQVDRIELPQLNSPTLRVDRSGHSWEVATTDFGLRESRLLRGRFGAEGYQENRWPFDEPEDLYPDELRTNSSAAALLVASRFDFGMVEYLPPFLTPPGSYSTLSEVSALHDSKRTALALTTLDLWCVEPLAGQRSFICGGNDREFNTWLWSIDAERRTITPMAALAGYYHGAKFAQDDELLLQGYATAPVVIELPSRRGRMLHVTSGRDKRIEPVPADMEHAGFDGLTEAPFGAGMGQHLSFQAMAKTGNVVAVATFTGSASTVTVYRVGSAALGASEGQAREW